MKKLLALITVLLFAGFTLAQNNTVTVSQSGGGSNSTVNSQADGATVNIQQVGTTTNSAITNQSGATGINNLLYIQQTGAINQVDALQTGNGNAADIVQSGALNNTIIGASPGIIQNGNGNKVFNVLGDGWGNPTGVIFDGTNPLEQFSVSGSNSLYGNQTGNDNKIGLFQKSTGNNSATINQSGSGNESAVYQGGSARSNDATSSFLSVLQSGNDNIARLSQASRTLSATISQFGNNNLLGGVSATGVTLGSAYQRNSNSSAGSTLLLTQNGNDKAGLYQRSDGSLGAYASIYQDGDNIISVRQNTDIIRNATLNASQTNHNNIALLDQNPRSGRDATATITQSGGSNILRLANADGTIHATNRASQTAGNDANSHVDLILNQLSAGSQVGLYQNGTGYEKAEFTQDVFTGQFANVYQTTTGGYNEHWSSQTLGQASLKVYQVGAGDNYSNVTQ